MTKTIVFDFDYTLTSWDSADRFFKWLLARSPLRVAAIVCLLPILGPLLLANRTRKVPVRYAVWVATFGLSHEQIESLVKQHVREIVSTQASLVLKDGQQQLRWHLAQGDRVVIATGSLEVLAREFLIQSGLGHVPLVGSTLKPFWRGMILNSHCFGDRKIPMLSGRGFPPPWAATYTDHECDLPVMGQSAVCSVVNPKPRAIRHITAKLGFTPAVLKWR